MRYCEYCGEEVPDNVIGCNCTQGELGDYLGRLAAHSYHRTKMGFWHEAALIDILFWPLLLFLILMAILAWI